MKTKKVHAAGKFGSRYGKKVRDTYKSVIKKQTALYECPKCGKKKVKRIGYALWECQACGYRFAGGAYEPFTNVGKVAIRVVGSHMKGEEAMKAIEEAEAEEKAEVVE